MSKSFRIGVLAQMRSATTALLAALLLAPDPAFADSNFLTGIVIAKNDSGKGLAGVIVQSDTAISGKPCLLETARTDENGRFRVRTDPACFSLTLRFSRGGYADALIEISSPTGEKDIGVVELERMGRAVKVGAGGVSMKAGRSRKAKLLIVGVVIVTAIAAGLAVSH